MVKQVVPAGAPANSTTGAVPQGGWTFTGTGSTGITFDTPSARVTAAGTGAANFPLTFATGTTSGPVTVNETLLAGYTLHTINGNNATCTRVDTGAAVSATNSGPTGFTVNVASTYPVSCVVYNQPPQPLASVTLNKQWTINGGAPIADGQQPAGLIATGTLNGAVTPWGQEQTGFRQGDSVTLNESTDLSGVPLCTLTSARLTAANGTTVNLALPNNQTLAGGANTYTITNAVTCSTRLKLTKTVQGGTAAPTEWTLTGIAPAGAAAGPSGVTGVNGLVTPNVTYTLTENTPRPEYAQVVAPNAVLRPGASGSWNCREVQADGTTVIPGFSDGLNGGVTVPFGRYISCEAVNQTATLELRKIVINDNGGTAVPANWQLTATPIGTFPPGLLPQTVTGSTTGASFNVRPGTEYRVSESGGPVGYSQTDLVCDVFPGEQRIDVVNLRPLDVGVCTFTNDDNPATLTLIKTVTNDNGGTAVPTAWTLNAGGPTPISGATGSSAVTNAVVSAGSYALSETGGPTGYTASSWSCTGGTVTGGNVAVANGANVVCTINNNDIAPRLTLVKTVTNDNGGTATPDQWTLAAGGPTSISGTTGTGPVTDAAVSAGTYTLSESGGPSGYTAGAWSCTGVTNTGSTLVLAPGNNATCTINNNDQGATLTLVKTVTNDNGGTALPTAWTLAAAGATPISGATGSAAVTNAAVSAGAYTLSETGGPAGYAAGSWSCTGGALTGAVVTVPSGGNVRCEITNNDQAA